MNRLLLIAMQSLFLLAGGCAMSLGGQFIIGMLLVILGAVPSICATFIMTFEMGPDLERYLLWGPADNGAKFEIPARGDLKNGSRPE